MGKVLESNIEMLLSFIILFFQNIDSRLFDRFIEKYGKLVGDDLYIGNEEIKIKSIWEKDTSFYADKAVVSYLNETAEEDHSTNVSEEVHAEQTKGEEVKEPDKKEEASEEVSTEQTKGEEVKEPDKKEEASEEVSTEQTKGEEVKEPDKKEEATSFQKGHNFSNFFDECIKSYILSPFGGDDLQQNSMLSNAFNSVLRKENDIKNFVNLVEKSKQFNKCVEYASRFGVHGKEDLSEKAYKEIIRKEYRIFVEDFCRILIKYQTKSKN